MPGSGATRPNLVFCAMSTHPDHILAAAGAARTAQSCPVGPLRGSAAAGPAIRAGTGHAGRVGGVVIAVANYSSSPAVPGRTRSEQSGLG